MRSSLDSKRFRLMLVVSPNAAGERDLVAILSSERYVLKSSQMYYRCGGVSLVRGNVGGFPAVSKLDVVSSKSGFRFGSGLLDRC
jgi:hypothetical protein